MDIVEITSDPLESTPVTVKHSRLTPIVYVFTVTQRFFFINPCFILI